jgi:hypothetical protein
VQMCLDELIYSNYGKTMFGVHDVPGTCDVVCVALDMFLILCFMLLLVCCLARMNTIFISLFYFYYFIHLYISDTINESINVLINVFQYHITP